MIYTILLKIHNFPICNFYLFILLFTTFLYVRLFKKKNDNHHLMTIIERLVMDYVKEKVDDRFVTFHKG